MLDLSNRMPRVCVQSFSMSCRSIVLQRNPFDLVVVPFSLSGFALGRASKWPAIWFHSNGERQNELPPCIIFSLESVSSWLTHLPYFVLTFVFVRDHTKIVKKAKDIDGLESVRF